MQATVDTGPRWPHSPRVAVAPVSVLSPLGCNHGTSASGASTASTGSVPTATIPEIAPSGGPTPAKLQGSWELVSKSGKTFKNRFELVIPARHYGFSIGLVRGEIVAQGNEVDLYNEDLCGLAFRKGSVRARRCPQRRDVSQGAADQATPTALDSGRRSPRTLLRAVVARLLGRKA
jgi:hypothetical protein